MNEIFKRFLTFHRRMGWLYAMVPFRTRSFKRFLESRGIKSLEEVDASLLMEYQRILRLTKSPATVNEHMATLRSLWRFLLREEIVREDVTASIPCLSVDLFIPHIYSERELNLIEWALKEEIQNAKTFLRRFSRTMRLAAYSLLRDCGMRVSEACKLNFTHYEPEKRTLRIERTKFFKTRIIPVPKSTCRILDQYLLIRDDARLEKKDKNDFFLSIFGCRISRGALGECWKELLCCLGIYRLRIKKGRTVFGSTNLHALRHTFAVRKIEKWQSQGLDVDQLLPLLSGYMGHVKVSNTTVYLHITPKLMETASKNFEDKVLPLLDNSRKVQLNPDSMDEKR